MVLNTTPVEVLAAAMERFWEDPKYEVEQAAQDLIDALTAAGYSIVPT